MERRAGKSSGIDNRRTVMARAYAPGCLPETPFAQTRLTRAMANVSNQETSNQQTIKK